MHAVRLREGGGGRMPRTLAAASITGPAMAHLERLGLEFMGVDARRLEGLRT